MMKAGFLVARAIEFYTVAPNVFSIITACLLYIQKCVSDLRAEQKASDNSRIYRTVQNCGPTVRNLLHVTFLVPRIWRWLQESFKLCGTCTLVLKKGFMLYK